MLSTMQCDNKKAYGSEREAKRVRKLVGRTRSTKLRVYPCPMCHKWHLTSAPKFDSPEKDNDIPES